MQSVTERLRRFKERVKRIKDRAGNTTDTDTEATRKLKEAFQERMDDDLDVKGAFDNVADLVSSMKVRKLTPDEASGVTKALTEVDEVLQVIF